MPIKPGFSHHTLDDEPVLPGYRNALKNAVIFGTVNNAIREGFRYLTKRRIDPKSIAKVYGLTAATTSAMNEINRRVQSGIADRNKDYKETLHISPDNSLSRLDKMVKVLNFAVDEQDPEYMDFLEKSSSALIERKKAEENRLAASLIGLTPLIGLRPLKVGDKFMEYRKKTGFEPGRNSLIRALAVPNTAYAFMAKKDDKVADTAALTQAALFAPSIVRDISAIAKSKQGGKALVYNSIYGLLPLAARAIKRIDSDK